MIVSPAGRSFIEGFEGCRLQAYLCPAGIPTIGYGHTDNVKMGDTLSDQAAADALLSADLVRFGNVVSFDIDRAATTQHEFDAMTSLAFNIGLGGFVTSTVLRLHKAGDKAGAARAFGLWNKATIDGQLQPVAGLTRRRAAEAAVYLTPEEQPHPMPEPVIAPESMPQAVATPAPVPAGYETSETGNVVRVDVKQSEIVKGANQGAVVASISTVGAAGAAVAPLLSADWKVILALGGVAVAAGIVAIIYLLVIKGRRIELNRQGIA